MPAAGEQGAPRLDVVELECMRDERILFNALTFSLHPGETRLIEGANGSGKTTLLRTVCGFVRPERGSVRWCGEEIERVRLEYQGELAYLGHAHGIKEELTPVENLRIAMALGCVRAGASPAEALVTVGLYGYEFTPVRMLSAGQRRRVALARLLVTDARLWILDEPFTALDKAGIKMVEALLEAHCAAGGMTLMSSHHAVSVTCSTEDPVQLSPYE